MGHIRSPEQDDMIRTGACGCKSETTSTLHKLTWEGNQSNQLRKSVLTVVS